MSPEVRTRQYWQIRRVALRKRHPILIPKLHLVESDPHTSWLNNSELYSYYGFVNCTLCAIFWSTNVQLVDLSSNGNIRTRGRTNWYAGIP